jgi:hypothetical protein
MELPALLLLLEATAAVVGKTVVQEATKSAYAKVKEKFLDLFGRRGSDSLTALEAAPGDQQARTQLSTVLQGLSETERKELAPVLGALAAAFQADGAARAAAEQLAAIRVDVSAGDNVVIQRIAGASTIEIKADAGKDFTLSDIAMKGGNDPGN